LQEFHAEYSISYTKAIIKRGRGENMPEDKIEYVGVDQAAEILGYSKRTIYKKLRKGEIPGQKVDTKTGKKWKIKKSDLNPKAIAENEIIEVKKKDKKLNREEFKELLHESISESEEIKLLRKEIQKLNKKLDQESENPVKKFLRWLFY